MRSSDWSSDVCSSDLEPAAVRRLHRSPAIRERLQLRAALFLDDAAELGIEAAMAARLLDADAEDLRRALGADLDAHARAALHARPHVLLVAGGEGELDHDVDTEADSERDVDNRKRVGWGKRGEFSVSRGGH